MREIITFCCSSCLHGANARGMTVLSSELKPTTMASPMAQAVTVGDVSGGTKTSQMWVSQVDDDALRAALSDSLEVGGLLAKGPGRYTLSAVLVSMNQPLFGFDMSVTASVWCTLVDSSTGTVVWQDMFAASSTKTMGDTLVGFVRLRLANEGALRRTLTKIVDRVASTTPGPVVTLR